MKFFMFHLMPWPYLPADFEERHTSAWVTCPNTYYDATRGTAVYNNYLDELQSAEALGFDLCPPPPLQGIVHPNHDRPFGHKGVHQQG